MYHPVAQSKSRAAHKVKVVVCRLALRTMYDAVVAGACDLQPGVTLAAICEGNHHSRTAQLRDMVLLHTHISIHNSALSIHATSCNLMPFLWGNSFVNICKRGGAGVEVKNAGIPELVAPQATGFADLSQKETQVLVSALHRSMLQAVDMMGVGSNVPMLNHGAEDHSSVAGFISAQPCLHLWTWVCFRRMLVPL
jgi:hypothetical protein